MSKESNIPQLRFKGFEGEFKPKLFDEITDITRLAGYEYSQYWKEDDKEEIIALRGYNIGKGKLDLIKLAYISNELSLQLKRSRLYKGDIVYPCVGSIGNAVVIEENDKYHIQQNIAKISCKKDVSPYFIVQFLTSDYGMNEVYRFNASGAQPNVLVGSLRKYQINIPTLPEQEKIASFLSAVDEKIQQLTRKAALLEQYKKGVMQQLFSGKLRFKDENGEAYADWEEKMLGQVAEKRIVKNKDNKINLVFTNSALQGIVNQRDFFDKDIANQNNLLGYYIVEKDDFVYNPRISTYAPVGPISRNHLDTGIMSPLYSVFRFKEGNHDFIEYFFNSTVWHAHMKDISNYGARDDRMSFSTNDFYKMPIPFPCQEEQQKIAGFLSGIDEKIGVVHGELGKMQGFKKGLLQQMFV